MYILFLQDHRETIVFLLIQEIRLCNPTSSTAVTYTLFLSPFPLHPFNLVRVTSSHTVVCLKVYCCEPLSPTTICSLSLALVKMDSERLQQQIRVICPCYMKYRCYILYKIQMLKCDCCLHSISTIVELVSFYLPFVILLTYSYSRGRIISSFSYQP